MTRAPAVLLLLVLLAGVYLLMYAGWSRRRRRHPGAAAAAAGPRAQPAAEAVTPPGSPADVVSAEGVYVSTVSGLSRHDRVTAGGLGARARGRMAVDRAGVRWDRDGAGPVHVDRQRIVRVGLSRGMAGTFLGMPRIVAVTWRADDADTYVTGFLPRHRAEIPALLAAVQAVMTAPTAPKETP